MNKKVGLAAAAVVAAAIGAVAVLSVDQPEPVVPVEVDAGPPEPCREQFLENCP